ncbi:hypothetical protein CJD36_007910 [Flavipsychrobacter stenotrophus]|uniref:Carboxypeptidase-like regulatory domain-containing protein n=1 Tax=Flavipsychrobacter stenotrophus TaxID=2077091 RepID=A0A2S7SXQ3_9BACT|nr:carboxypeptidase-like regulatory domain-containing protein [Flavipsychrobacter stenotrophus]PQJ11710.1 hypothetical protein CJD36_007910 [Flavipsychrobacter stenotrophus]
MKHQQNILTLHNPCNEDWERMPVADRGRYCAACQKIVMDFTLITSTRLAAIIVFLLVVITPAWSQQAGPDMGAMHQTVKNTLDPKQLREIHGRVRDVHNATMAGITVHIKGMPVDAVTDDTGEFTLLLPDTLQAKQLLLVAEVNSSTIGGVTVDIKDGAYVSLYLQPSMKIINSPSGKSDLIRMIGGAEPNDLVATTPGIYQQKRGGAAPNAKSSTPAIVPKDKPTFWERIAKPFRKKNKTNEAK